MHDGLLPAHEPPQLEKFEPLAAVAFKETEVPVANDAEHPLVPVQFNPVGVEVTVPEPVRATCKATVGVAVKAALTLCAALIDTVQLAAVPEQAPDQDVNV